MGMHRFTRTAGWLWLANIQYFIVQIIAAAAWDRPFSLRHNAISDLGNTACGLYGTNYVCSPLHGLMNMSFIALGVCQAAGALLLARYTRPVPRLRYGLYGLILAGLGTIVVGLFPENSIGALHTLGAFLPFVLGNIGVVLCAALFPQSVAMRYYSRISGCIALAACLLLYLHVYIGIGFGGMERITAYPQTIWMIVAATYMLRKTMHNEQQVASAR
jgi:hypothetical membrane protein